MFLKIGRMVCKKNDFILIFYSFYLLEWRNEQKVDRYEILRLIYQGRFLHGNVTLGALRLQQG
jgi:hypothetical protein